MTAILQYPEFFLAGLLALLMVAGSRENGALHCPELLARPAKAIFSQAPASYCMWMTRMLLHANWRNNFAIGDITAIKLYTALATLFLCFFLPLYAVLPLAVVIWFLPDLVLFAVVNNRRAVIRQSLPQAIDLLVLCVDAGLGLEAALQRISRDEGIVANALNEELSILSREIFLGRDREAAYQDLFTRTGVDELKTLGSALGQASKLGLSISTILRAQSELIRKRQSQKAETKALKMPIYMAFPLWFLIMPSLLLLVLGPSLIRFYQALHGSVIR